MHTKLATDGDEIVVIRLSRKIVALVATYHFCQIGFLEFALSEFRAVYIRTPFGLGVWPEDTRFMVSSSRSVVGITTVFSME